MTTGKTVVLTIWTFVGKVMSLLFNTLSRFAFQGAGSRECFQKTQISIFFFLKEREQEVSYLGKVLQGDLILEQLPVTSMASGLIHP